MPVANIISGSTELRFCSAAAAGLKYLLASQPENGIDGKERGSRKNRSIHSVSREEAAVALKLFEYSLFRLVKAIIADYSV